MKGFWKKRLPACLLALAMLAGTIPAASAAWTDLDYDVEEDDTVSLSGADFRDIYDDYTGGDLEYLYFTDYDDFDDYGYFTFEDFDGNDYDEVSSDELGDYDFYYDTYAADDQDIDLYSLKIGRAHV